jgi:hypothetical protein
MYHKVFRAFFGIVFVLAQFLTGVTPALAAAPANDNFADAEAIGSLPFTATVDNTEATIEDGERNNCGVAFRTVWYSFTPSETMALRVDMSGSQVDGSVSVFLATGSSLADLSLVGCVSAFNPSFNFPAQAGESYYLRVDSAFEQPGVLQLNLEQIFPPANDIFTDAQVIGAVPFTATVDNTEATIEYDEGSSCDGAFRTVWYSFTPSETMTLRVDMSGSQVAGSVNIYHATGPSPADLTFLGCASASTIPSFNFLAQAGQSYYLQVDSVFRQPGVLQLNLEQVFPPANDNFADSQVISSLPFSATVDITEATIEPNENLFLCTNVQRSVWYTFTPASSMTVNISMQGSSVSTSLGGIYQMGGSGFNGLSTYRCAYSANPPVQVQLFGGQTYYIQVSSYSQEVGTIQLNLEQIPSPGNDNFADAVSINSLPFSMTTPLQAASYEGGEPQNCNFMDRSVWYSFTPAVDMNIQAEVTGINFYNTNVNIYRSLGPGIADMEFLTCSIFNFGLGIFTAQAGQTYYLQAGNAYGDVGTITLNVRELVSPPNDNFADAIAISSLPFNVQFDVTTEGIEPNEPQNCTTMEKTVWFRFTPAETTTVHMDTQGTAILNAVNIFRATGPDISNLEFLRCAGGTTSVFEAIAGETYYLQVGTYAGRSGSIQLNLRQLFPPPNDRFAGAEIIESVPFHATADITDAWFEPNEPQPCFMNKTVWYAFTPTETMPVRASLPVGAGASNYLTAYQSQGPGISDLVYVGCTASSNDGTVPFLAEAGQTYYLQVGSFSEEAVTIQFDLVQIFPPSNDRFANAESVSALPFSATVDIADATTELGENQFCASMNKTIWYAFTPSETIAARVITTGISDNVNLYRSFGSGIGDQSFMGCTAQTGRLTFLAEAGQTYYLQVGRIGFDATADVQFDLVQLFPPANDLFANAEAITSLPFHAIAEGLTDATLEPNEQQWCYFMDSTVWYSFTPTETMVVRANTDGSTGDSNINVYHAVGPGISGLNVINCSALYNPVTFVAEAGQTYYLQAGPIFGSTGDVQVNLEKVPPPANDNFADAEFIGGLPVDMTLDITGAGIEPDEPRNCSSTEKTAWYSFTASEDMSVSVDTQGTSFEHSVGIYHATGSGIADLQFLTCIGSAAGAFNVQAGETYFLQAGALLSGLGNYQLHLIQVFPPANDNFADAIAITSLPFSNTADLTDAFTEFGEPQLCYSMLTTVWYSFTPSATTKVRLNSEGGSLLPNVNVFHAAGSGLENLQAMFCTGGSEASLLAVAGETYYFQVGGFGEAGTVQFNLAEVPSITGRITDASTGLPLPGNIEPYATAHLYRECGDGCLEFVNSQGADSEGHFSFDSYYYGSPIPVGSYRIRVTAYQYPEKEFGPFEFTGANLDVGDLALSPPAIIRGRAVDSETGSPLASASVTLRRCDSSGCFEYVNSQGTDGDGHFQFNSFYYGVPLPGGNYELEISASLHDVRRLQVTIADGENRDLGNVLIDPTPLIGSISGRLLDDATGTPIAQVFIPQVYLLRCDSNGCMFVNNMSPDTAGRFRFETDYSGNRLIVGSYYLFAAADQFYTSPATDIFEVGENMNRAVGDIKLQSYPVRFSDVVPCVDIPATGGDCNFTVKVWNGTTHDLSGKAWSLATTALPNSFAGYTNFQIKDAHDLDIAKGRSKVFRFRLNVPANATPYGTFLCTRMFVGEGSQALLNTIGFRSLFCIYRNTAGYSIASPQEVASRIQANVVPQNATEVEPNNSCQSPQDVGALSGSFVMSGHLDSSMAPDIDFFRFTGTAGAAITIDLRGVDTDLGRLSDPYLGVFDSNCNLIYVNDDSNGSLNSHLDITVPADGTFVVAATRCCDGGFSGGGFGSYELTVAPIPTIGSISGIVVDAVSGVPLRGDVAPYTFVRLLRCDFYCIDVNSGNTGSDGSFRFETDFGGNLLRTGEYLIITSADQYQFVESARFSVGESQDYDAGRIALTSFPIRFSDIQVCSVPTGGGLCTFNVKVTNGLATRFSGKAWSIIEGYGLGSFTNFTHFQTDSPVDVSLAPGRSTVLRFSFQVRGSVPNGANICATSFVGQNPNSLFNTSGIRLLFCFVKGSNGFTLMSEQQAQLQMQQMQIREAVPTNPPSIQK